VQPNSGWTFHAATGIGSGGLLVYRQQSVCIKLLSCQTKLMLSTNVNSEAFASNSSAAKNHAARP